MQANFIHDVAVHCGKRLTEAGYTYEATSDDDIIRAYLNVKHRRVESLPRKILKANYEVPESLIEGEALLLGKVISGQDLWPHQSRKITKADIEDGMLNDFGIQHFHLGLTPSKKNPKLIEGTKELLFAFVKDDIFYVLGIFDHSNWSTQSLLDIIKDSWPELMTPFELKGVLGLSHNFSDEEIMELRNAGITPLTQGADGSVRLGLGGGITTDTKSRRVTSELIQIKSHINDLQDSAIIGFKKAGAPETSTVQIVWRNGHARAVTKPAGFEVDLSRLCNFPPL